MSSTSTVVYQGDAITIPESLAADANGEYRAEKYLIQTRISALRSAALKIRVVKKAVTPSSWTWFRLPADIKIHLFDLYADMVSQLLGFGPSVNTKLREFLQDKFRSDHFKRSKDITYSPVHECIICIKSLRIEACSEGDHKFWLEIRP